MHRLWLLLGALCGLGAVALSAWAAHAAPARLDARALLALDNGIRLQGWHALALVGAALWAERRGGLLPHLAAAGFALGLLLFCGGVYASALAGLSLGPVAPIGGITLMAAWGMLAASAVVPR
ncbi:DUF423 domain-containing protein [Paracraurococcus ruber]|uniref:DUF423 domain-containing protein n=1 Tax=Paracraurococcus ruber TaxID=77675 RepID=A0ABS1CSH8_9PROT|nr:DUF423 domain-containing protein [Paracraurococcus ruber]MBK1657328.1 hypothetical protein [Paracraurococcus ruber]TDG33998.1 DUF423 domain-containing protein [Paracraurococcus ruber]